MYQLCMTRNRCTGQISCDNPPSLNKNTTNKMYHRNNEEKSRRKSHRIAAATCDGIIVSTIRCMMQRLCDGLMCPFLVRKLVGLTKSHKPFGASMYLHNHEHLCGNLILLSSYHESVVLGSGIRVQ